MDYLEGRKIVDAIIDGKKEVEVDGRMGALLDYLSDEKNVNAKNNVVKKNANAKKDAKLLLNQLFIAKKKNLSVIV